MLGVRLKFFFFIVLYTSWFFFWWAMEKSKIKYAKNVENWLYSEKEILLLKSKHTFNEE